MYRAKFVATVFAARQFVNHGHVTVNGKKVNIPSYRVKEGDVIEVRDRSKQMAVCSKPRNCQSVMFLITLTRIIQNDRDLCAHSALGRRAISGDMEPNLVSNSTPRTNLGHALKRAPRKLFGPFPVGRPFFIMAVFAHLSTHRNARMVEMWGLRSLFCTVVLNR